MLTEGPFHTAWKQSVRCVRAKYPFIIDAFVLLPDHLHCLRTLSGKDADYAIRWNMIKRTVSQQTRDITAAPSTPSRTRRRELGRWQRRFGEHPIRDERDVEKHIHYIHGNPVKHGYVECVKDWPYSSFRRFVARGIYPPDWAGAAPTGDDLRAGEFGETE